MVGVGFETPILVAWKPIFSASCLLKRCRTLSSSSTMLSWMLPCSCHDDNGLNL
ncbi:rCG59197 [Rattus norvegicus]|uniref:RCG59197 n=1 Tax=Rattus norvegicus TaxID=10116 RepID=A6KIT7_RAT|nr:rCG59197 [Rattus norvegicus]